VPILGVDDSVCGNSGARCFTSGVEGPKEHLCTECKYLCHPYFVDTDTIHLMELRDLRWRQAYAQAEGYGEAGIGLDPVPSTIVDHTRSSYNKGFADGYHHGFQARPRPDHGMSNSGSSGNLGKDDSKDTSTSCQKPTTQPARKSPPAN